MVGSLGTLGVIVEASIKAVPVAMRTATLVVLGLTPAGAVEAMGDAVAGAASVTGAVHLEASAAGRLWYRPLAEQGEAATLVRIEAPADDILETRVAFVRRILAVYGEVHRIDDDDTTALWHELRLMSPIAAGQQPVWRLVLIASRAAEAVAAIRRDLEAEAVYDWAGGRVWLTVAETADAGATEIRRVMAGVGGTATLVRARDAVRASVDVFEPLDAGRELIARRLKAVFDPGNILNVGRVYR
jgi:glycolate oxidase FAD binding subunit